LTDEPITPQEACAVRDYLADKSRITLEEIAADALKRPLGNKRRLTATMRRLGWEPRKVRGVASWVKPTQETAPDARAKIDAIKERLRAGMSPEEARRALAM